MSTIHINDLSATGINLFADEESYLNELSNDDLSHVSGGGTPLVSATVSVFIRVASKPITKEVAKRVARKTVEYSAASIVGNGVYDKVKKDD